MSIIRGVGNKTTIRTFAKKLDIERYLKEHLQRTIGEEKILLKELIIDPHEDLVCGGGPYKITGSLDYLPLRESVSWHVWEEKDKEKRKEFELEIRTKKGVLSNRYTLLSKNY